MEDKWNKRPPKTSELKPHELMEFLSVGCDGEYFTDWERIFCRSCRSQLRYERVLSDRQNLILDRGLLQKCWDQDSANWRVRS